MRTRQISEVMLTELFKTDLILKKVSALLTAEQKETIQNFESGFEHRKKMFEFLRTEGMQFCRVCGCTHYYACDGGCSWVEDDLCSACNPLDSEGDAQW